MRLVHRFRHILFMLCSAMFLSSLLPGCESILTRGEEKYTFLLGHPAWSPSGEFISCTRVDWYLDRAGYIEMKYSAIEVIDDIGVLHESILIDNRLNIYVGSTWHPDGRLCYADDGLTLIDPVSMQSQKIMDKELINISWSPDGERFVYTSKDGTGLAARVGLSYEIVDESYLTGKEEAVWSPDGKYLLCVEESSHTIWKVAVDDHSEIQLTNGLVSRDSEPVWSPDGTMIAFTRKTTEDPGSGIWVMGADGLGQRKIVDGISPSWGPYSRRIVYEYSYAIWMFELVSGKAFQLRSLP